MSAAVSFGDAPENKFVVVYSGVGAASDCVQETHDRLKAALPIDPCQIFTADLSTIFKNRIADRTIVAIPGGNAGIMLGYMDPETKTAFRNDATSFLKAGGCLHGTCAGGIVLSSGLFMQFEGRFSERYQIFDERITVNSLDAISEVPVHYTTRERTYEDYFYTDVELSNTTLLPASLRNKTVRLYDAGSPGWFNLGATESIVGCYRNTLFRPVVPAIIARRVENGRVWVQGPHPEIGVSPSLLTDEQEYLRKELFLAGFRYLGLKI
jgi:glutamine amidotransferase-like uncharacterized protein